jgi:hypothetical protein
MRTVIRVSMVAVFALSVLVLVGCSCSKPQWKEIAVGEDCGGTDVACTMNNSKPDPALCNKDFTGQTAVCWDGSTFTGTTECFGTSAWCTYKTTPAEKCTGGGNKGVVYKCE